MIHLSEAMTAIIGANGIGSAMARHCSSFDTNVVGIDPRYPQAPKGLQQLHRPDQLDAHIRWGNFVIMTALHTPTTDGSFDRDHLRRLKNTAILININCGATVRLPDLAVALHDWRRGVEYLRD